MKSVLATIKKFDPLIHLIEVSAIVAGVLIALSQLKDLNTQKSAELALKFNEYLDDPVYTKLCDDIEDGKPLLKTSKEHKGQFEKTDIEGYLGVYETMADLYEKGLISRGMLQANFSFDLVKAYNN